MMANNWKRLNIWLKTGKTFDYNVFKDACRFDGCEPQDALEFAQKAGMVTCGMTMYPELPIAEAYLKFVQDNQVAYTPPAQQVQQQAQPAQMEMETITITFEDGRVETREIPKSSGTGCGSCGGGQVR